MGETKPEIKFIRTQIDDIREKMKGERDYVIQTTAEGALSGVCRACRIPIDLAFQDGLVWYKCHGCQRQSLNSVQNTLRDIGMAREDGKPLVYELFYVDELPPRLRSPFDPASTKPACTTLVFQAAPPQEGG